MFIKLDTKILDSWCFADPANLKIWIWLLSKANYKKSHFELFVGKGSITVTIDRGQVIYRKSTAEKELCIDNSTIERRLKKMQDQDMIIVSPSHQYTIITICNYDNYQSRKEKSEPTMSHQQANDEPTMKPITEFTDNSIYISEEEKLAIETKSLEDMLVPEMEKIWKQYKMNYPSSVEEDYHALLTIAYYIGASKGWKKSDVLEVKKPNVLAAWDKTAKFICDNGDTFIKGLTLDGIAIKKNWQKVILKFQNHLEGLENSKNAALSAEISHKPMQVVSTSHIPKYEGKELDDLMNIYKRKKNV